MIEKFNLNYKENFCQSTVAKVKIQWFHNFFFIFLSDDDDGVRMKVATGTGNDYHKSNHDPLTDDNDYFCRSHFRFRLNCKKKICQNTVVKV